MSKILLPLPKYNFTYVVPIPRHVSLFISAMDTLICVKSGLRCRRGSLSLSKKTFSEGLKRLEARDTETFTAVYREDSVIVPVLRESNSLYQNGYGSLLGEGGVLTLTPCETLFLVERKKLIVVSEETRAAMDFNELFSRFTTSDRLIWTKYLVYRDLRIKGFVLRDGYGLGVDFLVYERGEFGRRPPKYLVHATWEGEPQKMSQFTEALNFAKEKEKSLKLAVIDRRGEVVYYSLQELDLKEGKEVDERKEQS